ncbi:MAG: hypothetical protein AAB923_00250 [Patescibacteria group bacterium]
MKNIRTPNQLLFKVFIRPFFPLGQWLVMAAGINKGPPVVEGPHKRQRFLLGRLKQDVTTEAAKAHLREQGFSNNRAAFQDPGQLLSMRRLCEEHSDRQYHVRIFIDGEVRGHYEYTPEDHPRKHLREDILEKREERFAIWIDAICERI